MLSQLALRARHIPFRRRGRFIAKALGLAFGFAKTNEGRTRLGEEVVGARLEVVGARATSS